jgi:hypothetical protein
VQQSNHPNAPGALSKERRTFAAARPNAHSHILAIAAFSLALADRLDEGRAYIASIHKTLPRYELADFFAAFQFTADLFEIPDILKPIVVLRSSHTTSKPEDDEVDPLSVKLTALKDFLEAPFGQIRIYYKYVSGLASFDTHQGVKGLEFERVMVIIDDAEARGFMFGYNKLFGIEAASGN